MKLPNLPLSGSARPMQSEGQLRAQARERELGSVLRGVTQLGEAAVSAARDQANNEARMQAISETARLNRTIAEQRKQLQLDYLEDDNLNMDTYMADDEKIVTDAVHDARSKLSRRALTYAESTLQAATGPAYVESRYESFTDISRFRTRKHMNTFQQEAVEDINADPAKGAVYFESGSELLNDLVIRDPKFRQEIDRNYKTGIMDAWLGSLATHGEHNAILALLDNDEYNDYIVDANKVRSVALTGVAEQFVQDQNSAVAAVSRDPANGDVLYDTSEELIKLRTAGTPFQKDAMERDYRSVVANQQLQSYINIHGNFDEAEKRLNEGFYDDKLSAAEIGDWMAKLAAARAQATSNKVTLDLHRADRYIDGVKNGDPAAVQASEVIVQDLSALETNPALTASQQITVREKRIQAQTYAENPHIFGSEPTQMSRAELDATIASVDSLLITPPGEDFEDAAARTDVVNDGVTRLEGLKREFDADPVAYLIKYNSDVAENYALLMNSISNVQDPQQLEMLPQYFVQHINTMDAKQGGEWGVADADVDYFPKNQPMMQNLVATLGEMDLKAKMGTVGFLAAALPPAARSQFMVHMGVESPGVAAAVNYASKGMPVEAESQLRGADRRAGVNATDAKVVKDGEVMEGIRRVGGVPFDAIPPGGEEIYAEVLLNEYYAIAPESEINSGVPSEDTLLQAQRNTWGEVVDLPFSLLPENRMLSYRRSDNNVMMTPAQVQGQLTALRDSRFELLGQPKTLYGGQVTQNDLITKTKFVPVGNGKYQLIMPEAVQVGPRLVDGWVMDEDDKPFVIDLNDYPVSAVTTTLIPEGSEMAF